MNWDRNTWQTISCGNHSEIKVGVSSDYYTFTQCEEVCERGNGTLVRLTKNNSDCLEADLEEFKRGQYRGESINRGDMIHIGLYKNSATGAFPCHSRVTLAAAHTCTPSLVDYADVSSLIG